MKTQILLAMTPVLLVAVPSFAADENTWGANLGVEAAISDNAKKSLDTDKIEEQQDKYSASLNGKYKNDWLMFDASYMSTNQQYEKASQPDRNFVDGVSKLRLGNDYDPASLVLNHSRRTILNVPDAAELSSNFDSRDIYSEQPQLTWRINSADLLAVRGDFSQVRIDRSPLRNSDSQGASLVYQRPFSPVDSFQIIYSQSEIKFPSAPMANYQFENYSASYKVKLREVSYLIQAGANSAKNQESSNVWSSPAYNVDITYHAGSNTFEFRYTQSISNGSAGNGNDASVAVGSQNDSSVGLGLINKKVAAFNWSSNFLCERCLFSAGGSQTKDDYQSVAEDGTTETVSAAFNYELTKTASLGVSGSKDWRDFSSVGTVRKPYKQDRLEVSFQFELMRDANLRVFGRKNQRDSESLIGSYQENIFGLALNYKIR